MSAAYPHEKLALVITACMQLVWSMLAMCVTYLGYQKLSFYLVVFFRCCFGVIPMAIIAYLTEYKGKPFKLLPVLIAHKWIVPYWILIALCSTYLNSNGFSWAYTFPDTTPVSGGVISPLPSIFVAAVGVCIGREKSTWLKWIGLFLGLAGCIVSLDPSAVVASFHEPGGIRDYYGRLLLIATQVVYSAYALLLPTLQRYLPPATIQCGNLCITLCIYLLTTKTMIPLFQEIIKYPLTVKAWFCLLYAGIICSACGFYSITWCIKNVRETSILLSFSNLAPILNAIFGYAIYHDALNKWIAIGAVMIICALSLIVYDKMRLIKKERLKAEERELTMSSVEITE